MTVRRAIHWQLLWFSLLAVVHGASYLDPARRLPPGLDALPRDLLVLYASLWLTAGATGIVTAVVLRTGHWWARLSISVMCGVWAGAYVYGWWWQDNPAGWVAAGLYGFLGLAVLTPPVWTVTIRHAKAG